MILYIIILLHCECNILIHTEFRMMPLFARANIVCFYLKKKNKDLDNHFSVFRSFIQNAFHIRSCTGLLLPGLVMMGRRAILSSNNVAGAKRANRLCIESAVIIFSTTSGWRRGAWTFHEPRFNEQKARAPRLKWRGIVRYFPLKLFRQFYDYFSHHQRRAIRRIKRSYVEYLDGRNKKLVDLKCTRKYRLSDCGK